MSLAEVKHQGHAQRVLQRALIGGRVPHAYLFHGPDGVGKELLARGLGQLLLCPRPITVRPAAADVEAVGLEQLQVGCGTCADCRAVAGDVHPDLHLIHRYLYRDHPESKVRNRKGLELIIDVVRHFLIERVGLTPMRGRAKVFIIREADLMNAHAQNALLKTLEEPPGATFLILLTCNVDLLLPTTQSRCQPVRFDALPREFIAERLRSLAPDLSEPARDWYARSAEGSLGRAMEAVDDKLFELNERVVAPLARWPADREAVSAQRWLDEAKALGENYRTRDPDISDSEATRRGLTAVLRLVAAWYADLLLLATGGDGDSLINGLLLPLLQNSAARFSPTTAIRAITRVGDAERHLNQNVNAQLCVDALLIALAGKWPTPRR
ncbi:MAG TPA: DNA polymerase III subunit delta' [Phycisphaerae bacterium]|nr:DNA polymerase III subunit delta' [Phycisphaerae bacterium]HNU45904.1 DNA polymerase III subunit delta' [Phycisphaerae bacterium]